jgi:MFS family permease
MLSLAIPAYCWLWFNSIFGTMQLIADFVAWGWLVLTLTDSPFWVGAVPALRGIMQILLGTFAGALLDRVNRRVALLIAIVGTSLIALAVGLLVTSARIELWHILVFSALEGMFMSIRWPAINTAGNSK